MPKFERIGIWIAVAGIAIFALVINSSLGGLQKAVEANATRLEQPTITASVLPGIPNALSEAWQQARAGAQDIAPEDSLWFTVRLANSGHDMAGEVSAELSLVPEIVKILAYGSGGKTLEASWGGPKIVEGGEQEKAVTVSFNALPEGESHLIFVAVRPDGFAEPPYATADREEWTGLYKRYWNTLTVTAAASAWADEEVTTVAYGLGSGAPAETKMPATSKAPAEADAG